MNSFATVMTLLRERQQFLEDIRHGVKLKPKLVNLFISSSVFFWNLWFNYWFVK